MSLPKLNSLGFSFKRHQRESYDSAKLTVKSLFLSNLIIDPDLTNILETTTFTHHVSLLSLSSHFFLLYLASVPFCFLTQGSVIDLN